ncbi:hypothetical protein ABIE27_000487 [Paenibacillus sp. 4624]
MSRLTTEGFNFEKGGGLLAMVTDMLVETRNYRRSRRTLTCEI